MRTAIALVIAGSVGLIAFHASAREDTAQTPPPATSATAPMSPTEPPPPSPPPPAPPHPVRVEESGRRGFYLRAGVGGGALNDTFRSQIFFSSISGKATGPSGNFELLAGGALKPGLILGGAFLAASVQSPKVTVEGATVPTDINVGTLLMFGGAIVWYPNPTGGLRLEGVVGGARISIRDKNDQVKESGPVGAGGAIGVGYEWQVSDKWSLGLLAQGMFASLREGFNHHSVNCGALYITGGYN